MKWMGRAMYWGHNALIRSKAFTDVGGEPEQYLSEDFAFTLKLEEAGWRTVLVPEVVTYEEQPPDFRSGVERFSRWMRGSYGLIGLALSKIGKVSFSSVFLVLLSSLLNLSNVALFFVLGVVLCSSSLFVVGVGSFFIRGVALFLACYVVFVLNVLPVFAVLRRDGLGGVGVLVRVLLTNSLLSMVLVFRCFVETVRFIVFRDMGWVPMRLEREGIGVVDVFRSMFFEFFVGLGFLIVGVLKGDLFYLMYFSPWIVAFLLCPFIVYYTSK
jgi:cellulose synthase/poly-beta-1,6-N-acetylglucosamine synthase-like glycosyltransferase